MQCCHENLDRNSRNSKNQGQQKRGPPKNEKKAEELRSQGNVLYGKNEFVESVEKYNESLCYAESQDKLALSYANRSAVCFELKLYFFCLENIKLAKTHGYPADKMSKLDERMEKCHRLMAEGADSDEDMMKALGGELMKLSHQPHPKIPYIVDCLDIQFNEEFGRHIVTKKKLLPGDIICIEKPYAKILYPDLKFTRCVHCMQDDTLTLIPCPISSSAMFCSETCKTDAFQSFYELRVDMMNDIDENYGLNNILPNISYVANVFKLAVEMFFKSLKICNGSLSELRAAIDKKNENAKRSSIFDVNSQLDLMKAVDALETHENERGEHFFKATNDEIVKANNRMVDTFLKRDKFAEFFSTNDDKKFLSEILLKNTRIVLTNCFPFGYKAQSANGIFPFLSLLNHSCDPNVTFIQDNEIYLVVRKVVKPGEQLFYHYSQPFFTSDLKSRQTMLRQNFFFDCKCEACLKDYPIKEKLPLKISDPRDKKKLEFFPRLVESLITYDFQDLNKVCEEIRGFLIENAKFYPCQELIDAELHLRDCYIHLLQTKLSKALSKIVYL